MKIREEELYPPLKTYLQKQGYSVNAEVKHCDIVATMDEEIIIIELKTRFTIKLVAQAILRKEITPSVYIALPVVSGKAFPPGIKNIRIVLGALNIGLVLVRFLKTKTRIEIVKHPSSKPSEYRSAHKKKKAIIREINGRFAEFNTGGQASDRELISAYKQKAIHVALTLSNTGGEMSPKELRNAGCCTETQKILSKNAYGWFERTRHGYYRLHEAGQKALENYTKVIDSIKKSQD